MLRNKYWLINKFVESGFYATLYLALLNCLESVARLFIFVISMKFLLTYSSVTNDNEFYIKYLPYLLILFFLSWLMLSVNKNRKYITIVNNLSKNYFKNKVLTKLPNGYNFRRFINSISSFMQFITVLIIFIIMHEYYLALMSFVLSIFIFFLLYTFKKISELSYKIQPSHNQLIFFIGLFFLCLMSIHFNIIKVDLSLVVFLYCMRFSTLYYVSFLNLLNSYISFKIK